MHIKYHENILYQKFKNESWFNQINSYLIGRYSSIERRLFDTDRYVSVDPKNNDTFSYEYSMFVIPFSTLSDDKSHIPWWKAYTDLKHSEIDNEIKGNLRHCIGALAALAVLFTLMSEGGTLTIVQVFSDVGMRGPKEELEKFLFYPSNPESEQEEDLNTKPH